MKPGLKVRASHVETHNMKRRFRQVIAILAAFCIAFSGMPLMAGSLDAHAASKFTIKSAKAVSSSAVKLT